MNTGVGDAVDLGWKLAATLQGWGGPQLLPSYDSERRSVGIRNRAASARHAGIRFEIARAYNGRVHEDSARGALARKQLGAKILELGNLENEALGIELGYRYDDSPVICHEGGQAPAYGWEHLEPSTWPGMRLPSVYLEDGSAIFDKLAKDFTLLRFADVDTRPLERAAAERRVPLEVVDVREDTARHIYDRDLVLVRPDQHVAWCGNTAPEDALGVIERVRGFLG